MSSRHLPSGSTWPTTVELDDLVSGFRGRTLPKSEWTHLAHLAVGTWHIRRYGPLKALPKLRTGIRCLNDSHGTPNSDRRGYHETITRAYVTLIADFLSGCPADATPADCVQALLASALAERNVLLDYYSKERLKSVAARRGWLEPDRRTLRFPPRAPLWR
jgi:hypothetical protein